jgi:hypothetical protein
MKSISRKPIAIGLAAAIALAGGIASGMPGSASAAPLGANQSAVKDAVTGDVINVHRRGYRNGAAFAALAIGVIGAVIAHQEYKRYRKRHQYYYAPYAYYPYPYATDAYRYHAYPHQAYPHHHRRTDRLW